MVQLFADNDLVYSPFMEGYGLIELTATVNRDKGGTAEIVMPPGHPAYNRFVSHRTIVTIYRADRLIFRGRSLYPTEDFCGIRKITCEGERCFLRDAIVRPYLWQTDPATIFRELIAIYNAQVDEFKKFKVGRVTVTDPNDYVRLESESAETVLAVADKLVERVGGYITFTTNGAGEREINWLAALERRSGQTIEFGENLLDFSSSGENTNLATRLIAYGAKNEATGKRITIASVNGGLDYVQDDTVIALRGIITDTVTYDDVTEPANLLRKVKADLDVRKLIVTTLTISAVDLSDMDMDIDTFLVGDWMPVLSLPHGLDDLFSLTERKYDFLNPGGDTITMGKQLVTLTGAGVSDSVYIQNQLAQTASSIKTEVQTSASQVKQELVVTLGSKVNETYVYETYDGLLIQWGTLEITNTAHVEFAHTYADPPSVQVTPIGTAPANALCCVDAVTSDGVDVYANAKITTVNWLAIGKAGSGSGADTGDDMQFVSADGAQLVTADGQYFKVLEGTT